MAAKRASTNDSNDKTTVTSCLARGTRVKTPDGWVPIESLEVGDEVVAWDHEAGEYVSTAVTHKKKGRRKVIAVSVGNMRLRMTSDHPVWSPESDEYRPAKDWVSGELSDLLRTTRGTEVVEITDRISYDGRAEVHGIAVDHQPQNFVADGFVVHHQPN